VVIILVVRCVKFCVGIVVAGAWAKTPPFAFGFGFGRGLVAKTNPRNIGPACSTCAACFFQSVAGSTISLRGLQLAPFPRNKIPLPSRPSTNLGVNRMLSISRLPPLGQARCSSDFENHAAVLPGAGRRPCSYFANLLFFTPNGSAISVSDSPSCFLTSFILLTIV